MTTNNKYYQIAGILISLAGVAGAVTLDDAKYSIITLLGVAFLLLGSRQKAS